jgi:uncharacterized RDD family membrane protein YckC
MMDWSEQEFAASFEAVGNGDRPGAGETGNQDYWRQEVISRLQQHRARRRKRADPDASLSLELEFAADMHESTLEPEAVHPEAVPGPRYHEPPPLIVPRPEEVMPMVERESAAPSLDRTGDATETFGEPTPLPPLEPPKILRFPRPATMHRPLARPPMTMVEVELPGPSLPETPRIVYAAEHPPEAEQLELLPSFEDIRLEAPDKSMLEEIELVPHPAPLHLRALAGMVDVGIVLATTALLAYAFMRSAGDAPLPRMALPCLLAGSGVLWMVFQYLFLVHGERTPGMKLAGLELATFSGGRASVFSRQCRALACALSAFSVGLGYAWTLVDEDQLGWHDRITGTCVQQKQPAVSTQHSAEEEGYSNDECETDLPY